MVIMFTLDEAIEHFQKEAEERRLKYQACPFSSAIPTIHCDGKEYCKATLRMSPNDRGCLTLSEEFAQIADWLKELKEN